MESHQIDYPVEISSGIQLNNQSSFHAFCKRLVNGTVHQAANHSSLDTSPIDQRPSPASVWGLGLLFVTLISLCAAVGIGLMPLLNRRLYYRLLTYFVGLGVGSLSGSAIFHLLPQAFGLVESDTDGNHDYLNKAWLIVAGVYLFFFTDKFLQLVIKLKKNKPHERDEGRELEDIGQRSEILGDGQSTPNTAQTPTTDLDLPLVNGNNPSTIEEKIVTLMDLDKNREKRLKRESEGDDLDDVSSATEAMAHQAHAMCSHEHAVEYKTGDSVIGTVAWMIIFGDGLHNFIDGLSIGAAFSESVLSGISISVAVLCEEFPHELGDVAILISAGMTFRQALVYNLLSAGTCYIGFVIGVLLGELAEAQVYIFALAGGMFLYISLGSMVPEMNKTVESQMKKSTLVGLKCMGLQASGVLTGLLLMYLMSYYGSFITFV